MSVSRLVPKLMIVSCSITARLLGTLALFALLARATGPADFGHFAYWYAFGLVVGTVTDYGFAQQVLRNVAADTPDGAAEQVKQLGKAKASLAFVCAIFALTFSVTTSTTTPECVVAILLILAGIFGSFYEFYAVVMRSRQFYRLESKYSFINSLAGSVVAGLFGYWSHSILLASAVLATVRLTAAGSAFRTVKNAVLPDLCNTCALNEGVFLTLRRGFPYAFDNIATQLFANLDAVSAKHLLDSATTGIYLAGTRLVQASLSGIPVIASVFLPSLTTGGSSGARRIRQRLFLLAVGAGVLVFSAFVVLMDVLPSILFGSAFSALSTLMPWFGLFVFFRYCAAAPGIALTAVGAQKLRAMVTAFSVVITLLILGMFYRIDGGVTSLHLCQSMAIGSFVQCIGYLAGLALNTRQQNDGPLF